MSFELQPRSAHLDFRDPEASRLPHNYLVTCSLIAAVSGRLADNPTGINCRPFLWASRVEYSVCSASPSEPNSLRSAVLLDTAAPESVANPHFCERFSVSSQRFFDSRNLLACISIRPIQTQEVALFRAPEPQRSTPAHCSRCRPYRREESRPRPQQDRARTRSRSSGGLQFRTSTGTADRRRPP